MIRSSQSITGLHAAIGFLLCITAVLAGCSFDPNELEAWPGIDSSADGSFSLDGNGIYDVSITATDGAATISIDGMTGMGGSGGNGIDAAGGGSGGASVFSQDGPKDISLTEAGQPCTIGSVTYQPGETFIVECVIFTCVGGSAFTNQGVTCADAGNVGGAGGPATSFGGTGGTMSAGSTTTGGVSGSGGSSSVVVDTIGADPVNTMTNSGTLNSNVTKVDVYSVTTATTLVRIEFYLDITTATALNWVVYEAASETSAAFVLVSSTTTYANVGQGYQASGVLGVSIKAGYYYAIGVSWGATTESYWINSTSSPYPMATSFGSVVTAFSTAGTNLASIAWNHSSSFYPERLTTSGAGTP